VSIGAALAEARRRAGLSVSQVSRRTRIREAIIQAIERDDYSACGGDFYARGHIRALARAVGADPGPLIQQYDAAHRTTEEVTETVVLHPGAPAGAHGAAPAGAHGRHRTRRQPRGAWAAAVGLAAVAVLGSAAYYAAAGTKPAGPAASSRASSGAGHAAAHHRTGTARHPAGHVSPRPAPAPTHSAAPPAPRAVPARALAPVSAAAFGPGGVGQGDNPESAGLATDGSTATCWHTDWYTTAEFGNLQPGTGLLLDMGRPVAVTAARITLGSTPGADLQVRTGNVPALADLHEVASAADAGGVVRLRLTAAAPARYALIWFTKLPPDASGTFQADICNVALQGRP
jgi:transcriptional regulator with XRE-family HTH domain